jgi:hypothetical protein
MSHEWNCHLFNPVQQKSKAETDQLRKSEWAATATVACAGNDRPYTAEISYRASGHITVEWDPCTPIKNGKGQLTKIGLKRYQERRNQLAQQVADYIGGAVMMAD